jgi:hypothetical protein
VNPAEAPPRKIRTIPYVRLLAPIALIVCAVVAWLAFSASAGSSTSAATQAGLSYARENMEWQSGPSVVQARTARVGELPGLLPKLLDTTLRRDVNMTDLVRHYGADRQVDAVVLTGVYNTLPPDEGLNIRGEVLALVDVKTNRVLFLTD